MPNYHAKATAKATKPGCWNKLLVEIYDDETKIGEYERNYYTLYNTFFPFQQKGKWYALYSSDYTASRVMTLPDCKDLCGEEFDSFGFCPTGFYVPWNDESFIENYNLELENNKKDPEKLIWYPGSFGFVCGCHWGDDTSWKIQFLDLREIEQGKLIRSDKFGYIELAGGSDTLKDCINLDHFYGYGYGLLISHATSFDLNKNYNEEEEK